MHAWLLLMAAIATEVAGTMSMKLSDGLSRLGPSLAMVVCYSLSFVFLSRVLRYLEVGVAYAIWSALGTGLVALIGVVFFAEALTGLKVLGLALIIAGVISLNISGGVH